MTLSIRGGLPVVAQLTVDDVDGREVRAPGATNYLQISNEGASDLKVYFTRPDFENDMAYLTLAATTGYFGGPVEIGVGQAGPNAAELGRENVYLKGSGGSTDVVLVWYVRRG